MPLTREEWEYLHEYVVQAQALSEMALKRLKSEGDAPQPRDGLRVLMTATDRALADVQAVADGLLADEETGLS